MPNLEQQRWVAPSFKAETPESTPRQTNRRRSEPPLIAVKRENPRKRGTWRGLFFKLFVVYCVFLLTFKCPPSEAVPEGAPALCRSLHNRIDDVRPFYTQHVAPHLEPHLAHPFVQKSHQTIQKTVIPKISKVGSDIERHYYQAVHPHLSALIDKVYTFVEVHTREHRKKAAPHVKKAHEAVNKAVDTYGKPAYAKLNHYHTSYGKPALDHAHHTFRTKVQPQVYQASSFGAKHGQIYWTLFRKWFHDHVVVGSAKVYRTTFLPQINKIKERLNFRSGLV